MRRENQKFRYMPKQRTILLENGKEKVFNLRKQTPTFVLPFYEKKMGWAEWLKYRVELNLPGSILKKLYDDWLKEVQRSKLDNNIYFYGHQYEISKSEKKNKKHKRKIRFRFFRQYFKKAKKEISDFMKMRKFSQGFLLGGRSSKTSR